MTDYRDLFTVGILDACLCLFTFIVYSWKRGRS